MSDDAELVRRLRERACEWRKPPPTGTTVLACVWTPLGALEDEAAAAKESER